MTRDDLAKFRALEIDFEALGLLQDETPAGCFCTPVGAEYVGRVGCDGVHFVLLPGDEGVLRGALYGGARHVCAAGRE